MYIRYTKLNIYKRTFVSQVNLFCVVVRIILYDIKILPIFPEQSKTENNGRFTEDKSDPGGRLSDRFPLFGKLALLFRIDIQYVGIWGKGERTGWHFI
jgi:hypothetical protein